MSRTSRDVWVKRVERWAASDLTAKEFASEIGVKAGTLSHWKWQLGNEARSAARLGKRRGPRSPAKRKKPSVLRGSKREPVSFTEVMVEPERAPGSIEIVFDARRVVRVGASFDGEALSRVLDVIEARP